jgi:hypothetical protein
MSYDNDPDWTNDIVYPDISLFKCLHCGKVSDYATASLQILYPGGTSYKARSVPDKLVFTCSNVDCAYCDEDYTYSLSLIIIANCNDITT